MSRKLRFLTMILTFLLLAAASIAAQVTTGSLQGVVKDPNGAVVVGANIKITNTETGVAREAATNGDGFYRVTNLLPGDKYKIDVSAKGYNSAALENIAVRLASENSADIQLQVQGATANVEVTAGNEQILQTTQNQLKTDFSTKQLTQLPLNGAGVDSLALLVPGVITPGDTAFSNGVGISANGNRGRSNNFQLDGQDNNDNSVAGPALTLTNTEAVGEFQVITNNFSAEFGRNSGAQINSITKAGTNSVRGSLFEFHNNSRLDARNNLQKTAAQNFLFLANNNVPGFSGLANRNGKDPFRINQFGAALGGPIKKDRAFFFITYQGTYTRGEATTETLNKGFGLGSGAIFFDRDSSLLARQLFNNPVTAQLVSTGTAGGPAFIQGQGQFLIAPPTLDTNGDGIGDTFLFGPGNPFGNSTNANRLQPSLFVCTVNPGAGACPAANLRTLYTGESVRIVPTNSSTNELITREDFNLTDRDIISARYIFNKASFPLGANFGRSQAGALFDVPSKNHNLGLTYTRIISPKLTNEARFNYQFLDVSFGDTGNLTPPSLGFSGQRDLQGSFFSLAIGTTNVFPQSRKVLTYQEQDTISTTIGNHAVKAGFDLRQQRTDNFFLPNFLGAYTFRGGNNSGTVPAGTFYDETGAPRTGRAALAFENFLLNRPRDINFAVGSPTRKIDQNDYFFFVQDDWRARSNLTLNLGLRYELSSQPFNPLIDAVTKRESDASTALFNTAFPLETRTLNRVPLDKNNFAPRVGFAYSPDFKFLGERFSNGRTVIRGGFGISYDPSFFNIVNNTVTAAPFVGAGFIRQNNPGLAGSVGVPFLPSTSAQLNVTPGTAGGDPRLFNQTRVSSDFHNPYSVNYNFGIQQELWKNTVLEVRYVGTLIRDQFQSVNANPDLRNLAQAGQFLYGDPMRFTNGTAVTPFTGAGALTPTAANGFNTRGVDANGNIRINGSGRLDPNLGVVRLRNNGASGRYDGLQTEFRSRLSNLAFNINYSFSKTTDNASEIFASFAGGQTVAFSQNPFDTDKGERGLSAFHQKHSLSANFVYELPFYRDQKGFTGKLLGGFQLTGIVFAGSGRPYTPLQLVNGFDVGFEGAFNGNLSELRPFNGNPNAPNGTIAFGYAADCLLLFGGNECNTATPGSFIIYNSAQPSAPGRVVTAQEAQQQARLIYNDFGGFTAAGIPLASLEAFNLFKSPYGNVGRNTFLGEPLYRADLGLFKTTNISERLKIELRAELTNLFNHRNFGVPNTAVDSGAALPNGTVVTTFQNAGASGLNGTNRTLRLGLKVVF